MQGYQNEPKEKIMATDIFGNPLDEEELRRQYLHQMAMGIAPHAARTKGLATPPSVDYSQVMQDWSDPVMLSAPAFDAPRPTNVQTSGISPTWNTDAVAFGNQGVRSFNYSRPSPLPVTPPGTMNMKDFIDKHGPVQSGTRDAYYTNDGVRNAAGDLVSTDTTFDPTGGLAATDPNLQGITPFSQASLPASAQPFTFWDGDKGPQTQPSGWGVTNAGGIYGTEPVIGADPEPSYGDTGMGDAGSGHPGLGMQEPQWDTSSVSSAGIPGVQLASNFPTGDDALDKLLQDQADKWGWKDVPTMQDFWGHGMENLNIGPPFTANPKALPISEFFDDPTLDQDMRDALLDDAVTSVDDFSELNALGQVPGVDVDIDTSADTYADDIVRLALNRTLDLPAIPVNTMPTVPTTTTKDLPPGVTIPSDQMTAFQAINGSLDPADLAEIATQVDTFRNIPAAPAKPAGPTRAELKAAAAAQRKADEKARKAAARRAKIARQALKDSQAAAARAAAASAAQAKAAQDKARAVLAAAAGRDRGGPSEREINAAIEVLSEVDTFGSGGMRNTRGEVNMDETGYTDTSGYGVG